jgi:hypothetical protein
MNEQLQVPSAARLSSVDMVLAAFIRQVETNINTPTREWTWPARKRSLENIMRTADEALACLDEWMQTKIGLKNGFQFVDWIGSIKSTARHSTLVESRCWGRTDLRQGVKSLKELFGEGCEFEDERVEFKIDQRPNLEVVKPGLPDATFRVFEEGNMTVDPNQRPYSINELTVLHNLSRRTVIRLYENEPGVQILQASRDHQQALGRRHRTIRVPRHVYMRVKHRLEKK